MDLFERGFVWRLIFCSFLKLEDIEEFFAENGRRLLTFVYFSDPNLAAQLNLSKPRTSTSSFTTRLSRTKVQLADIEDLAPMGECVFFGRVSTLIPITRQNIEQVRKADTTLMPKW